MPNMRLVWDNAALRSTLAASSQVASFPASNLLSNSKSKVWRSTLKTDTLTLTWGTAETVSCVAIPHCNLSPTAQIRVRAGTYDSGTINACVGTTPKLVGWTAVAAASAYSYGGGAAVCVWFPPVSATSVTIDITDNNNLQGYVEAANLVVGSYWSPTLNPAWNPVLLPADSTKNSRTDAGNLRSDKGYRFKKLTMNLANMSPNDRTGFTSILEAVGLSNAMLISLFPESTDKEQEKDYMMMCKMSQISSVTLPSWNNYSAPLELEQV